MKMQLTPEQRRQRIYELLASDAEYCKMKAEYEPGRAWFEKNVGRLPKRLRNRFWTYPGLGYFMHHRMLTLICRNMKFGDED